MKKNSFLILILFPLVILLFVVVQAGYSFTKTYSKKGLNKEVEKKFIVKEKTSFGKEFGNKEIKEYFHGKGEIVYVNHKHFILVYHVYYTEEKYGCIWFPVYNGKMGFPKELVLKIEKEEPSEPAISKGK